MAPIYFVTIPGLDEPGFEQQAAAWFARVRRRQHFDLRPWFDAGRQALEYEDVRTRLDDLDRSLHTRLSRLRRIASAPGNLPAHNPRFVGREVEMRGLHEAAGLGQLGVISAVHGIGGLGKTALAIQYAFAYADFYPGGRWLIGCAGMPGVAAALRTLDADLGVEFTDDEKLDDTRAAKRILQTLQERSEHGAAARSGEPNPPQPRALLILDNIDDARLLHPPHTDLLSGRTWLHVLATTRLGPKELSPDDVRHRLLAVDELPADDALRLIESYQPQGRFAGDDERAAAREIVTLLQGFTLAVEVVAVHLAERAGRLTCAALRDRLVAEGLTGLENIAGQTTRGIPHVERLVTVTLAPTLAALSEPESLVLALAALLPPDHVPLPWLRAVAAETFPDLGQDAPPGYDDPWLTLVNHLISLRLLQVVELADDGRTPRLCRIHRLVQEVVKKTWPDDLAARERALLDHIRARGKFLWDGWVQHEHRWELAPLTACADHWLERDGDDGPWLASTVAGPLQHLGNFAAAERLNRRAVERTHPDNPNYAARLNNLAVLLQATNRLAEAEPLYRRALAIDEASHGPDHPDVAIGLNNLAALLQATNRLAEAEPLFRRALAIDEASYGPDHPDVAIRLNNLAVLLQRHQPPGRGRAAVPAGAGDRRDVVRPRPPQCRHRPQQPGGVASDHQPPGRGRAALSAAWRSTRRRTAPTTPTSPATSTTWRCCSGPPTAWPRPSRSTGGRWRSTRRRTAPTTPMSRSPSTTWRCCSRPPTAWPRPSRSSRRAWRSSSSSPRTRPRPSLSPPPSTSYASLLATMGRASRRLRRGSTRSASRSTVRSVARYSPGMNFVLVDRSGAHPGRVHAWLSGRSASPSE